MGSIGALALQQVQLDALPQVTFSSVVRILTISLICGCSLGFATSETQWSKGLRLAETGSYQEAWIFLENLPDLESPPANVLAARAVTAARLHLETQANLSAKALVKRVELNPNLLLDVGEALGREGLFESARKCFQRACVVAPGSFRAWMNLASTFYAQNKFQEVLEAVNKAIDIAPSSFPAHYLLGSVLISLGKTMDGITVMRKAQTLNPVHVGLLTLLALEYIKERYYQEAVRVLEAAVKLEAGNERLRWLLISACHSTGDYSKAYENGLDALTRFPESARLHLETGIQAEALGDFDRARSFFEKTIELDPTSALGHYYLGDHLYKKGSQYAEAIREFQKAIELAPDYADAYLRLGTALTHIGNHEEALAPLLNGTKVAPDDPRFHLRLSQTYARLGNREKALAEQETFERLRKSDTESLTPQGRPFPK
ncbi:MAG: tetratricopeptide repeat protein [Acidobacteria bacterium]|nr:tetratricopeptide repeat protein [Acidobacteriota bacterium]